MLRRVHEARYLMLTWLGFRTRLVLLLLLSLLPAMGLLLYSALQERHSVLAQARARLQSQALLVAAHHQRLLEKANDVLVAMVRMPVHDEIMQSLCGPYLTGLQAQHPELDQLGLLGLDGRPVCASESQVGLKDAGEAEFFRQVLAGEPLAVDAYREGGSGLILARPVRDPTGQLTGVAFATLSMQELTGPFGRAALVPSTTAALLDPHALVLAANPPAPGGLGRPHPESALLQAAQTMWQPERPPPETQTREQIYALAPVLVPDASKASLLVVLGLPQASIAAQSRPLTLQLLGALALALCGLGGSAWVGWRLLVRPTRAVLQAAQAIDQGQLASRADTGAHGLDEIGQIGQSLNHIAETQQTLQARQRALEALLRESERERTLLSQVLNSMSEGVVAVDTESRFLLFNHCASRLHEARPAIGSSLAEWRENHQLMRPDGGDLPPDERPLVRTLRHGISLDNQELLLRSTGTEDMLVRMSTRPLHDAQGVLIGGVAVFNDITQAKAAEKFLLAQEEVLSLIAAGAPLPESLRAIVQLIEKSSPGCGCLILPVDGQQLRHGVSVGLPAGFVAALEGLAIAEGQSACGTAAFRREMVVVEDTASDPLVQAFRPQLQAHGLNACWAAPVISGAGEVLAVFVIYRSTRGAPQPRHLELIATASRLARITLARAQAEAALIGSEARFRELAEKIGRAHV